MKDWQNVSIKNNVRVDFRFLLMVFKMWLLRQNMQVTISWEQKGDVKLANAQLLFERVS